MPATPKSAAQKKLTPGACRPEKNAGFREKSRKKGRRLPHGAGVPTKTKLLVALHRGGGCAVPSAIAGRPYLRSRRSSDWVMSREIEIEINWMAPMMRSA